MKAAMYRTSLYLIRQDVDEAKARGLNLSALSRAAVREYTNRVATGLTRAVQRVQVLEAELEHAPLTVAKDPQLDSFKGFLRGLARSHVPYPERFKEALLNMESRLEQFPALRETFKTPEQLLSDLISRIRTEIQSRIQPGSTLAHEELPQSRSARRDLEDLDRIFPPESLPEPIAERPGDAKIAELQTALDENRKEVEVLTRRFREETIEFFTAFIGRYQAYAKRMGRAPTEDELIVWIESFVPMASLLLMIDDLGGMELARLLKVAMGSGPPTATDQVLKGLGLA